MCASVALGVAAAGAWAFSAFFWAFLEYGSPGWSVQFELGANRIAFEWHRPQGSPPTIGWFSFLERIDHAAWRGEWICRAAGGITAIHIPVWALSLTALVAALVLRRLAGRPLPHLCPRCGYDLSGSPAGRCPECGPRPEPRS
jgi:hypothetical protein